MVYAPGRNFLLVVGILYIIFGALNLIGSAVGLASAGFWDTTLPTANDMPWRVYYTFFLAGSLFQIFIGIIAVVNYTRLERAYLLRWLGSVSIFNRILRIMFASAVFPGGIINFTAFVTFFGLALPILLIIGAHKNLNSYRSVSLHM